MAVLKVKRSNPLAQHNAQPNPQHAKNARTAIPDRAKAARSGNPGAGGPTQPPRRRPNPLATPQLYDILNQLNRGYGTALISLDNLEMLSTATRPQVLPAECLRDIRNRTEELRALANRDCLPCCPETKNAHNRPGQQRAIQAALGSPVSHLGVYARVFSLLFWELSTRAGLRSTGARKRTVPRERFVKMY